MIKKYIGPMLLASSISFSSGMDKGLNTNRLQEDKEKIQKEVFLTIDDGPSKYTKQIVELLDSLGHKGTFFFIGQNITPKNRTYLLEMQEKGHEIGNHSYSHKNFSHISFEDAKEELVKTDEKLQYIQQQSPKYFRFPGGNTYPDKKQFKNFLDSLGCKIVPWDIDTRDRDKKTTTTRLIKNLQNVKEGDIILIHERSWTTGKTLHIVDSILKSKNLISVPLSRKYPCLSKDLNKKVH